MIKKSCLFGLLLVPAFFIMVVTSVSAQEPPGFFNRQLVGIDLAAAKAAKILSTPQLIAADLAAGNIDEDTAYLYLAYALGDFGSLPPQYHSDVPWRGTLPLLALQDGSKKMKVSPERAKVIEILSGTCSSSSGILPSVFNSTNFHIEYGAIGGGLNISDYSTSLETTWNTEVGLFGWAAPPVLPGNPPPGNRYHVRVDALGGGLYGYVSSGGAHAGFAGNNPNTTWNDVDAYASCMVLNNDYSSFAGSAQQALDATTAHEFNHSIQFGYGAITGDNEPDANFVEGGATWMEEEVFDSANDNYNYLWPDFDMCMGQYTESPYPYWIAFHGMTEQYGIHTAGGGEQIMQDFWELTSQNSSSSNMLTALNTALVNKGNTLANAYHDYAIAVKFNKSCGGGYTLPHCFEEAAGYVSARGQTPVTGNIATVGNNYSGNVQDNYALNWISLPTSGIYTVGLQNTSGGGQLRGSVVCDTGSSLNISPFPVVAGSGDLTSLPNFNTAGCTSVVAVVTNQTQTAANPPSCAPRSYTISTATGGGNTPPTLTSLPDRSVPEDGSANNAIDLWAYATDAEDSDAGLTFTISNSPNANAGVSIDTNRYIDINPVLGWSGMTDVTIQVEDSDSLTDTDTFRVTVGGSMPAYLTYLPFLNPCPALANGNFEGGPTQWTEFSTHNWDLIVTDFFDSASPHGGSWGVWLGGDDDEISYIQQTALVPAGSPYLGYWHWIDSGDSCGRDFGRVLVNGTVVNEYDLCISQNTNGWVKHVVNLSAYAGQCVSLQILSETNSSTNSNLLIDDVAFQSIAARTEISKPEMFLPANSVPKSELLSRGKGQ